MLTGFKKSLRLLRRIIKVALLLLLTTTIATSFAGSGVGVEPRHARVIDIYAVQPLISNSDKNNNNKDSNSNKHDDGDDNLDNWPPYENGDVDEPNLADINKLNSLLMSSPSKNHLCNAINNSPFYGTFVYCCNNQLFKKPERRLASNLSPSSVFYFRCCQGAGLFTDTESMDCCGKTLYEPKKELCVQDVVVPIDNYLNTIMYPPHHQGIFRFGPTAVRTNKENHYHHQNDFPWPLKRRFFVNKPTTANHHQSSSSPIDHPAETEHRLLTGVQNWEATHWLNCSGRLVFNPEGRHASLLDCCGQMPYKRDRFYCVGDRLVELSYNNGQWLPPVVAPQSLRPPFELDFAFTPAQRSALLSCSGVWYSISFTNLFLNNNAGEFGGTKSNQRYSCCGQQIYDVYDSVCTDENIVRKRSLSEMPYGVEVTSHTLIMCGDFNAIGWRPDLGSMPAITYLVDDSLPPERRPDSCCGVQLYSRSRYGCSVNGIYPLTRVPRESDISPPTCKNGRIVSILQGLSPYWQCCDQTHAYNTLDSICCGSTIVSIKAATLCCNGVLYSSVASQGEKLACCGRNRYDSRFYHCFDSQVRHGPKRTS